MADESSIRDLFDRWERVWHEGQYGLVPECVGPHYIRHDEAGDRTVARDAYAAEVAKIRQERHDIGVVVLRSLIQRRARVVSLCVQMD
jgi:hypothetical protein